MDKRFEELRLNLAEVVRAKRTEIGLSQEALALAAEIDRTYVSQVERGIANPSLLILYRLAQRPGRRDAQPAAARDRAHPA
ncbi:MAG: helix-turn-helix domain-containing protein [Desulfomicrobium escambiense]|nr:helix-turn-helix domain-containing protein [Desulfomicrobium escambiense]